MCDLADTFMSSLDNETQISTMYEFKCKNTRESIIHSQKSDSELEKRFQKVLVPEEAEKVSQCFMLEDGLLVRKYHPPYVPSDHHWEYKYQVVVPTELRPSILKLAHDIPT